MVREHSHGNTDTHLPPSPLNTPIPSNPYFIFILIGTVCIVTSTVGSGVISGANLGDSGLMVLRPSGPDSLRPVAPLFGPDSALIGGGNMGISFDIIHRTKQQEHNFGYPFQVGHHDMSDDPEDAEIFDMNIHQGDVIVAGSDGSCNSVNRPVKRVVVCATLAVCSSDMWTNVRVRVVVVVGCGMSGWNLVGTQYSEGKSFLHFFPSSFVIFFAHPFSLFLLLSVSLFLSGLFDNVSEEEIAGMVGATVSEVKAKVLKSDQEAREKRRKKERRAKEATVTENGGEQAAGAGSSPAARRPA